jgi:hypothetical protein
MKYTAPGVHNATSDVTPGGHYAAPGVQYTASGVYYVTPDVQYAATGMQYATPGVKGGVSQQLLELLLLYSTYPPRGVIPS